MYHCLNNFFYRTYTYATSPCIIFMLNQNFWNYEQSKLTNSVQTIYPLMWIKIVVFYMIHCYKKFLFYHFLQQYPPRSVNFYINSPECQTVTPIFLTTQLLPQNPYIFQIHYSCSSTHQKWLKRWVSSGQYIKGNPHVHTVLCWSTKGLSQVNPPYYSYLYTQHFH